jgi:hypothetical protein
MCKSCGEVILRDMCVIEKHMDECRGLAGRRQDSAHSSYKALIEGGVQHASIASGASVTSGDRKSASAATGAGGAGAGDRTSRSSMTDPSKILGGIVRKPDIERSSATRIIYHTAKTSSDLFRPREVCALQDCFMDEDGTCYAYEVSVRHCDVSGIKEYTTAEVLLLLHIATPIYGSKQTCDISIISQVDSRARAPKWLLSLTEEGGGIIGAPRRMDLVRELKASGNLEDILDREREGQDDNGNKVSLNNFELMAVLGRGGFGKVMQVRHRDTNVIYAMKILKKSELQRRRQVERTKTEVVILFLIYHSLLS